MKVALLHGHVPEGASKDELDTLVQADAVAKALVELGHEPVAATFSIDLKSVIEYLASMRPDFVFNLVESVEGSGRLIYLAPALLDFLKLPYTGSDTTAFFLTSNKLVAKDKLRDAGIPTPEWVAPGDSYSREFTPGDYIIKSLWEHASVGLDEDSIVRATSREEVLRELSKRRAALGGDCFAERYIDGREFNISVLASDKGPEVLPPSEMVFDEYPEGKTRVVGYRAKWEEDSFEFKHTVRRFDFTDADNSLLDNLTNIAKRCWRLFGLRGYARVDFRVDADMRPFVLEINANPCLSPDAGFAAAAARAGLDFTGVVRRIISDVPPLG